MIDWTKPIQTRDGRKAEYLKHRSVPREYPVICLIGDDEDIVSYKENGSFCNRTPHGQDIINAPAVAPWIEDAAKECANLYRVIVDSEYAAKMFIAIIAKHARGAV